MLETDCCGNGCAHCILDAKPITKTDCSEKRNIFENGYIKFKLIAKTAHSTQLSVNELIELHFKVATCKTEENSNVMLYVPPGHHIMMRIQTADEAAKHLRPYSPFWIDMEQLEFKILVNLKPQGVMSRYFTNTEISELAQAEELPEFRLHNGIYKHAIAPAKCLVIISQGVAIASTIPIIEEILHNEDDDNRIIHLACFQDLQHIYFRQRLRDYAEYWNYWHYIYVAHENCRMTSACRLAGRCANDCEHFQNKLKYKEHVLPQRLTSVDIMNAINAHAPIDIEVMFVLSGSRDFQNTMQVIVDDLHLPLQRTQLL